MEEKISQTMQILEEYAKNKQQVYYHELYERIGLNRENPSDRNKGSHILAEINKISIAKNNTMLSSLVTLKGANEPADGFFEFSIEIKRLKSNASNFDRLDFWVKEMKNVFNVYGKCDG